MPFPFVGNMGPCAIEPPTPRSALVRMAPKPAALIALCQRAADPKKEKEIDRKIGHSVDLCNTVLIKANMEIMRQYELKRHPNPRIHLQLLENENRWLSKIGREIVDTSGLIMEKQRVEMRDLMLKPFHIGEQRSTSKCEERRAKGQEDLKEATLPGAKILYGLVAHLEKDLITMRKAAVMARFQRNLITAMFREEEAAVREGRPENPIDAKSIAEKSYREVMSMKNEEKNENQP